MENCSKYILFCSHWRWAAKKYYAMCLYIHICAYYMQIGLPEDSICCQAEVQCDSCIWLYLHVCICIYVRIHIYIYIIYMYWHILCIIYVSRYIYMKLHLYKNIKRIYTNSTAEAERIQRVATYLARRGSPPSPPTWRGPWAPTTLSVGSNP